MYKVIKFMVVGGITLVLLSGCSVKENNKNVSKDSGQNKIEQSAYKQSNSKESSNVVIPDKYTLENDKKNKMIIRISDERLTNKDEIYNSDYKYL